MENLKWLYIKFALTEKGSLMCSCIMKITFKEVEVQISSVAQLCPILCDPMDCSRPGGFPVHHQLPELAQTHVH